MGCNSVTLILLFTSLVAVCNSRYENKMDWDHYVFMQQYPAGQCACLTSGGGNCSYSAYASEWTIHGLWPTRGSTDRPDHCSSTHFNWSVIKDLLPDLKTMWTDLQDKSPVYNFWKHEWLKHGSCSNYSNMHDYFTAVLKLFKRLNYGIVLSKAQIKPSENNVYYLSDFQDAFKKYFNVSSMKLECKKCQNVYYLIQAGVCLSKRALKAIDCPNPTSSCKKGARIAYPPLFS